MKIGIITFHFVHNQGAVLQCYALQKKLEMLGHEVKIIDYRPKYHTVRYDAWKNPFRYSVRMYKLKNNVSVAIKALSAMKAFVKCMNWNIKGRDRLKAQLFTDFLNKNLKCTRRYTSLKELQKDYPEMDMYISGSDQLWNPDLLDFSFDPAYFLDFGKKDSKRLTYAVSIGKEPTQDECQQIEKLSRHLDAISLREQTPAVVEAIGRDIYICVDPTLLLDAEDYFCIESEQTKTEPYIFVYGFDNSQNIHHAVDEAVAKYGCRIINGSPDRIKLTGKNIDVMSDYGPDCFLTFIKNAECVVTNSFHGTVFSIIYKKKFITVPHPTRGRRMIELLEKLELTVALWGNASFDFDKEIDYIDVYQNLKKLRADSLDYLLMELK